MATRKTTKKAASKRTTTKPANADLDDALFVPRLDRLALPETTLEGSGPDYGVIFESICGVVDDSQAVEQYDGTLGVTRQFTDDHQLPVAQVQWNNNLGTVFTNPGNVNDVRWGSGTMIGPDLFLTCGHLFDAAPNGWTIPRANGTSTAISPQQAALNMHLNFEYQVDPSGVMRAEQRFPITQLIEYRLGGIDMALCRIGGSPGNTYGWTAFATANPANNDMLAIIGHPAGMPKRIEAGPATNVTTSTISYNDIDTLGGNSGSGILHSPSGRVVGVHTNGGCNTGGTGANTGVAIAQIISVSPTLQSITPSSQTAQAQDGTFTRLALDTATTTVRANDLIGTLRAEDTGLRDQIATRLAADVLGTVQAADTGLRDQLGTLLSGDVGTFAAGDDPNNTLREQIFDPGNILFDPAGPLRSRQQLRPFVQAGPSMQGGEATEQTLGETVLTELEALIAANAAIGESLNALYAVLQGTESGQ